MSDVRIAFMQQSDVPEAATVLSIAMLRNPLHVAVFHDDGQGDDEQARLAIAAMFAKLLSHAPGIVFVAKEQWKIVGVMRMTSCQGKQPPGPPEGAYEEHDATWRKYLWQAEWARRDPTDQHWHLGPIGVLPASQGSGIGSRLMERFCREVDACGAEAYLETDKDTNVRFYEMFGFRVVAASDILGVTNRYMLRAAAADPSRTVG